MKVTFRITKEQFNLVVQKFTEAKKTDYYFVGEGAYNAYQKLSNESLGKFLRSPVRLFLMDADIENSFKHVRLAKGYTVNENGAMYATSAFNCWGVYKYGMYYEVFYIGARSRITDMPFFDEMLEKNTMPQEYESSFFKIEWYQNLSDYLVANPEEAKVYFQDKLDNNMTFNDLNNNERDAFNALFQKNELLFCKETSL